MSQRKSLVKNAADPKQVKRAADKEQFSRDNELNDLRKVLETPEGRRFVWRVMQHCKVFGSVWEPSAKIHFNSGRQDVGHFVMGEVVEAGEDYLLAMMKENKERMSNNV